MIDSIVNLGKAFVAIEKNINFGEVNELDFKDLVQYFSSPPFDMDNFLAKKDKDFKFPNIFFIEFKKQNKAIKFVKISQEVYKKNFDDKVLNFPARGGAYSTPTLKIVPKGKRDESSRQKIEKGIDGALKNIKKYFNKFEKNKKYQQFTLLSKINKVLDKNLLKVKQQLVERQLEIFDDEKAISTSVNSVLSIKIDNKLPSLIEEIVEVFKEKLINDYLFKKVKEINVCSLCHDTKSEKLISGNFSPFTFYTSDKRGYIAGGFDKKLVYLNYPVCEKCALFALIGRAVLKKQFDFKLGGISFHLIPRMLFSGANMMEFLYEFNNIKNKLLTKKITYEQLSQGEELILDILSDFKDSMVFNFLFYELTGPGKSVFNILLHIQDISPSRIRKINEEIKNVDDFDTHPLFPGINANKFPMIFSFQNLKNLFYDKRLKYFDRDRYLQTLWILFTGRNITFKRFLTFFFKKLKNNLYLNNSCTINVSYNIKDFIPIVLLFKKLNQLIFKGEKNI